MFEEMGVAGEKPANQGPPFPPDQASRGKENRKYHLFTSSKYNEREGGNRNGGRLLKDKCIPEVQQRQVSEARGTETRGRA